MCGGCVSVRVLMVVLGMTMRVKPFLFLPPG